MTGREDIHVKIGEIRIGQPPDVLKATLGSCVGIAFLWKAKNRFGLAHCLLPEAPGQLHGIGAKYVDQAVSSLIQLMKITPEDYDKLEVFIAGGGNMMEQLSRRNPHHVGILNAEKARAILGRLGIKINGSDLGGEQGRQIRVNCSSGTVEVTKLPRSLMGHPDG